MRRADVSEGRTGLSLAFVLNVVDMSNACAPISDVDACIRHCDRDGAYSGHANQGTAGESTQLLAMSGSVAAGYPGTLQIGIAMQDAAGREARPFAQYIEQKYSSREQTGDRLAARHLG